MREEKNYVNDDHRKKWIAYLLEFVMIFLAVTLSFFAESYRDNLAERTSEREFIQSFVEDLKTDTATIVRILAVNQLKMSRMDSLILLLRTGAIKGHESDLYFMGRMLVRSMSFISNDRTISQLKYSGSLRLIRNQQAADSIMAYQKLVEGVMVNQDDERNERSDAQTFLIKIFDPFVFDDMVTATGVRRPANNPPLLSYDADLYKELAYHTHIIKGSEFLINRKLERLKSRAMNILLFFNKEYQLD